MTLCSKMPSGTWPRQPPASIGLLFAGNRSELPLLLIIQGIEVHAPLQEKATLLGQVMKRILKAVINLTQKPGAELDRKQLAGELHRIACLESTRFLEDLKLSPIAADTNDLGLESGILDDGVGHLVLTYPIFELHRDHGTADANDSSLRISHPTCLH